MIADGLKYLASLVSDGHKPHLVRTSQHKALLLRADDEPIEIPLEPPPEEHRLDTLDSLLMFIEQGKTEQSAVFVSEHAVWFLVDIERRTDGAILPLHKAPQFSVVSKLSRAEPLSQRELHELLRHDLYPHAPPELKSIVRKVQSHSNSRASSEIERGRERGTMEFQAEVTSEIELPEAIEFHLPVFVGERLDTHRKIACSLDVTLPPASVSFKLEPYPGEIASAVDTSLRELQSDLARETGDVPVLIGTSDLWRPGKNGFVPRIES